MDQQADQGTDDDRPWYPRKPIFHRKATCNTRLRRYSVKPDYALQGPLEIIFMYLLAFTLIS